MSTRSVFAHPAKLVQAASVLVVMVVLFFVFVVAHNAPLWLLQAGMFGSLTFALAWPPKTFRTASVWALWILTIVSIVLRFIR